MNSDKFESEQFAQMKIGIISFYKGNHNYGGILQAYALQKYLKKCGHEAYQICLDYAPSLPLTRKQKLMKLVSLKGKALKVIYDKIKSRKIKNDTSKISKMIAEGFNDFEKAIPHTQKVYRADEMEELNNVFDIFICGSDQVWAPLSDEWYTFPHEKSYFLAFTNKRKISYAASFGVSNIPEKHLQFAVPLLEKFDAISVRESSASITLNKNLNREVAVVVDPTLLFTGEEWIEMLGVRRNLCSNPVMLAYLLGKSDENRKTATACANELSAVLKVVPFIGEYTPTDFFFGDEQLIGITPKDFLEYIYNADYIVTDSLCRQNLVLFFHEECFVYYCAEQEGKYHQGQMEKQ